jgi:FHA domain
MDKHNPKGLHFVRQGKGVERKTIGFLKSSNIIGKLIMKFDSFCFEIIINENFTASGRDDSADIILKCKTISRKHCTVEFTNGRMFIENNVKVRFVYKL